MDLYAKESANRTTYNALSLLIRSFSFVLGRNSEFKEFAPKYSADSLSVRLVVLCFLILLEIFATYKLGGFLCQHKLSFRRPLFAANHIQQLLYSAVIEQVSR